MQRRVCHQLSGHEDCTCGRPGQPQEPRVLKKHAGGELHADREHNAAAEPHSDSTEPLNDAAWRKMWSEPVQKQQVEPVPTKRRPEHQQTESRPKAERTR